MNKLILAVVAASAFAAAVPAFASDASVGYTDFSDGGFNVGVLTGRYSWTSGVLGVEGEAGVGVKSDSGVKVDSLFGGFVTAQADVSSNVALFGRVGYFTASASGFGVSGSGSGVAYGVGAKWFFDDSNGLRVEYTNYDSSNSYGVSYVRRFK